MPRPLRLLLPTFLAAPLLAGCASAPDRCGCPCPTGAVARAPDRYTAASLVHGRGAPAVWSYLAATHDRDHDGRVTATEHPRGAAVVGRLDRDGDGALTRADFDAPTLMANYLVALVAERIAADPPAPDAAPGAAAAGRDDLPSEATLRRAFERTDRDGSGAVDAAEVDAALATAMRTPAPGVLDLPAGVRSFPFLLEAADADRDGRLTAAELVGWRTAMEAREARSAATRPAAPSAAATPSAATAPAAVATTPPPPPSPAPSAAPTSAASAPAPAGPTAAAPAATARPRRPEAPAVGSLAPDFTLRSRGGATTRTLSDLRGTPVVLIFGSYTCPPFRASAGWIRAAYDRHAADARFLFVYVREAHAIDGRAPMPEPGQPVVEEPATFEDRRAVADVCALDLRFGVFETLVDGLDDAVARAYVAPPARLYVLGRDGKIVYRSGPGPFGLKQAEFDDAVRAAVAPAP